ncbi:MAG: ABC transporter permease [Terriglobia bacterium]
MLTEIFRQAWDSLRRQPLRSFLTMLGIVWGIVAVTLLIAYGASFRFVMVDAFEAFGRDAVICWPGSTSEQAGGERAGKHVVFEQADVDLIRAECSLVKQLSPETVRWLPIVYDDTLVSAPIRGVFPEYGQMRDEVALQGRWFTPEDMLERRRLIFLGGHLREKLFGGRPAAGETVTVGGVRFTVVGVMDRKLNFSGYFTDDDDSSWIPYTTAGDLWNNRYASVLVFTPISPRFEKQAMAQVRATVAKRQRFSPTDPRSIQMFGRQEFRPVIDALSIGLEVLLTFIGALTLGIGGVGVMNIMLVSVDERIREIGLRRALGARRRHIRAQFLCETLVLTLIGGIIGIGLSYLLSHLIGTLPLLGEGFKDTSGRRDIHLNISFATVMLSTGILLLVGVLSGLVPALRASRLNPVEALRYE